MSAISIVSGPFSLQEEETITIQNDNCELYLDSADALTGTLYVTSNRIAFHTKNDGRSDNLYTLNYPSVVLHAICKDTQSFGKECVYCQLKDESCESDNEPPQFVTGAMDGGDDEDDDDKMDTEEAPMQPEVSRPTPSVPSTSTAAASSSDIKPQIVAGNADSSDQIIVHEVRIAPASGEALQPIFDAMTEMSALHPDPYDQSDSDDSSDDGELDQWGMPKKDGWVFSDDFTGFPGMTNPGNAMNTMGDIDMANIPVYGEDIAGYNADEAMEDAPEE